MKRTLTTTIATVLLVGCVFVATQMAFTVNGADLLKEENEPDPRNLLEAVAKARQEIVSGKLQFEVFSFSSDRPLDGTNKISLDVVFDGENRRFEQLGREYSYVLMGPNAGKVTDAKRKELGLDKEGAVRAGLLKGFESHHVTTYDGNVILDYSETDGRPNQTDRLNEVEIFPTVHCCFTFTRPMKHILITTTTAVLLVRCGKSQESSSPVATQLTETV